jgi:LmbE family N-acetylglucosaminyl deacetylase
MTTDAAGFPGTTLDRAVLVVAHPDDEALWFTSILGDLHRIVVCFRAYAPDPDLGDARDRSLAEHPLRERIVDLGLEETVSFGRADWADPVESPEGLVIDEPEIAGIYARRAADIAAALPALLEDASAVFTHNPWGEYGHEDHVQVCRLVTSAAAARALPVWYSLYAGVKSLPLLGRYLRRDAREYVLRPTDPALGREIAEVYRRHGAWTWYEDFRWFGHEAFVRGPLTEEADPGAGWLGPINLIAPRPPAAKPPAAPPALGRRVRRRLGKAFRGAWDPS